MKGQSAGGKKKKMRKWEGGMKGLRPLEGEPSAVGGLRLEAKN
jgi:hypothetical protein